MSFQHTGFDDPRQGERWRLRRLGGLALFLATAGSGLITYAANAVLPFHPFELPAEESLQLSRWIPQGWGFFTRDPREPDPYIFLRAADGRWRPAAQAPNKPPAHGLGLSRSSRALGIEMGLLLV